MTHPAFAPVRRKLADLRQEHDRVRDAHRVVIEGVRPAILGQRTYDLLTDLKGFRHFERHNDRFRFDEALTHENYDRVLEAVPAFHADIEEFIAKLSVDPEPSPEIP